MNTPFLFMGRKVNAPKVGLPYLRILTGQSGFGTGVRFGVRISEMSKF